MQVVEEGVKAFGRIDALVSNAGICPFAEFLTMPVETYARTRAVNLDGSFFITQGMYFGVSLSMTIANMDSTAVAKQMKEQVPQGGTIVGISSISAFVGGEYQV